MIKINIEDSDCEPLDGKIGEVLSFVFIDPDKIGPTDNCYCVGLKYKGGKRSFLGNWEYDHTNYWDNDKDPEGLGVQTVSLEELEKICNRHGTTIKDLSKEYLKIAFPMEHNEIKSEFKFRMK